MAIKSLACPECQAPAVPGRYACAQCGALLASVGMTARDHEGSASEAVTDAAPAASRANEQTEDAVAEHHRNAAPAVAPAWTHTLAAEPEVEPLPEPGENERWDDEVPVATVAAVVAEASAEASTAAVAVAPEPSPVIRPTAKPRTRATAKVKKVDPAAIERIAPLIQPLVEPDPEPAVEIARVVDPERPSTRAIEPTPGAEPVALAEIAIETRPAPTEPPATTTPPVAATSLPFPLGEPEPAWPPPGAPGLLVEPFARVPAGSYLPPSAVLSSGEAIGAAAINGRPADPTRGSSPAASEAASPRISAADRLAQLGLPADTPRRVVGIGAVVAVLGFLLPWAPVLAGSGLLGGYWSQWGLAGPGHWIVALVLVGLAVLSLAGGRLAAVSVGLPAVAIATLLAGLSWPYLFGFLGRAVGIWVVLFGAILLVSAGLLDLRAARHGEPDSTV